MNLWGRYSTKAGIWKDHWCWSICCEAPLLTLQAHVRGAPVQLQLLQHTWTPRAFQNLLRTIYMRLKVCIKHLTPLACDFTDVLILCIQISKPWMSGSPNYAFLFLFKYFHSTILIWSINGEKNLTSFWTVLFWYILIFHLQARDSPD